MYFKDGFFIEIAKPVNYLLKNVGDFSDTVSSYNDIIKDCLSKDSVFVKWQPSNSGKNHILPDGHHLSITGHREVARACLENFIKSIENDSHTFSRSWATGRVIFRV